MHLRSLFLTMCLAAALPAAAQQLKLPSPSPGAKVSTTAGLTDIAIEYSSPAVKGRKIWGGLVPNDKLWRAGANKATQISFSAPVVIGDKDVPAGNYSFFAIPGAQSWTLVLNKNTDLWGTDEYKQDQDLVRVTVKPQAIPNRERLTYLISSNGSDAATIDLEWEKVRVTLPVKLKTAEQAAANIKAAADSAWLPMNQAARYYLDAKDYANAATYADRSIAIQETWYNTWVKAQALAGQGKFKEAYPLAEKAQALGQKKPDDFFFADEVKKALTEWKGKS